MKHKLIRTIALMLASFALAGATAATAAGITASIDPTEISLGEAAQLTVTIQGREDASPEIPAVDGLAFEPIGQSSQIRIVNGTMSANVTHTFAIVPGRAGTFTIPAIKVRSGREVASSQPVIFKVFPSGQSAANRAAHGSNLPAPTVPDPGENVSARDQNSFGFLQIVAPKKAYYLGETVPVELRACFRAGVELRVDGLPQLNSDAFAMNKLGDEPSRSQQIIEGAPYTVFSWTTAITALKAGDYELNVQIPTTVTVRQPAGRSRSRGGSPFGDDFFSGAFDDAFFSQFFGRATQKQVVLSSRPSEVKILSLPSESRPEDFSGAVGQFDITAEATPAKINLGDPVTLKLQIRGSGNFDRVTAPAVAKSDTWKSYPASAKFAPADSAGLTGEKTFEQALVPRQTGPVEIPALAFSYFDPGQKHYVTRSTKPILIEVAPGQLASAAVNRPANSSAPSAGPASLHNTTKPTPSHSSSVLPTWLKNPWVIATLMVLALSVWVIILLIRRQQRLARDPKRIQLAETQAAVAVEVQIMESAVARGATFNFFAAARRALQIQLGRLWNLPPQTITQAEINTRMGSEAAHYWPVFEAADQVTYTGRICTRAELRYWQDSVKRALARLGKT